MTLPADHGCDSSTVRAAVCRAYGGPEAVVLDTVPRAALAPDEVRVRVHAASVNFPDVLLVADRYQVNVPVPFVPGSEFAGVVTEVSDDVSSVVVGERVMGTGFVG
ncbi:MAG TPA: alcohol dehydrogenase catalytic domain-containing protein, partial [Acidimicrobiales bacterium]